jgi:DNA recombination protein RmuC
VELAGFGLPSGARSTLIGPVEIVATLIGLLVGAAGVWLLVRDRLEAGQAAEAALGDAERELTAVRAELDVVQAGFDEKMLAAVKAASADAYASTSTAFLALAGTKLEGSIAPLRQSLDKVEAQVQSLERSRQQAYGALDQRLVTLSQTTGSLATALRAPHVRGSWGEMQLKRIVELAGMLPYCDFVEQATAHTDDGRLRPDLVVRLPGGKQVVVDSKTPAQAYLDAAALQDDAARRAKLAEHARQVRDHIGKLSAKSYWQQFSPTPDYVVMFVPDEGFFRAAWESDRNLVETAVRARVHIASPTTLIALLQAIAYGWQQETAAEDARAVQELGRELYDRLAIVGTHFARVGNGLKTAVGAFNSAVGSIESRVLPTARKLDGYVLTDKELPELEPVAEQPRALQAIELLSDDGSPRRELDAA